METEALTGLAAFALATSITPGPNNLMLMASGARHGLRPTVPHLLGIVLGSGLLFVLLGTGLGRLFEAVPRLGDVLRAACLGYLAFLAWRVATAPTTAGGAEAPDGARPMSFLGAALFQWVNPKGWAMAMTAVGVWSPSGSLGAVLSVTLVFAAVNLPSISLWALLGTRVRRWLGEPWRARVFNVSMAVLLVASVLPMLGGEGAL